MVAAEEEDDEVPGEQIYKALFNSKICVHSVKYCSIKITAVRKIQIFILLWSDTFSLSVSGCVCKNLRASATNRIYGLIQRAGGVGYIQI